MNAAFKQTGWHTRYQLLQCYVLLKLCMGIIC